MSVKKPKVSIGLAVYNGEKYLEEAIDSILAQTYTDFELIVSDNASTDLTQEICQNYAAKDPRIRYSRNATNIGGANNENLTFGMAQGEYFRWAAHDDICANTLIEKCVEALDRDPSVVLSYPIAVEIDENGNHIETVSRNHGASPRASDRFITIAGAEDYLEEIYGLIRSDALSKTRLQQNYVSSDRTLLSEISVYGQFYQVPEPLFFKRRHPGNVYIDWRARMAWFDPARASKGKLVFPFWNQFLDTLNTITRVPLPLSEKIRCYAFVLGPWLFRYGKNMVKDILYALNMILHSSEWRKQKYETTNNWS